MNPSLIYGSQQIIFALILFTIACVVAIFDYKFSSLRDGAAETVKDRPYSFGRVQLSWWTAIICASFVAAIFLKKALPNMDPSLILLLGISGATTVSAKLIDAKAGNGASAAESRGFFSDILNAGDIHRLQTMIFNVAVGAWFVAQVAVNLTKDIPIDNVLPAIPNYILALLAVSSATYLAGKAQE